MKRVILLTAFVLPLTCAVVGIEGHASIGSKSQIYGIPPSGDETLAGIPPSGDETLAGIPPSGDETVA